MERFGKFQLLELIGRGGMAEVYLAKPSDAVLSKLVAVKRILPDFYDDPSFREMFQREGSIALAFRHHGIIAVHEMGAIEEQCYMTMEFFPGKTLATIVNQLHANKGKVDANCVAFIIMRIAEALNYIHDFRDYGGLREIIHRDISPHNIMVGFDGAIKLIDFGIAKDTSVEVTQSRSVKGKIAYMSPEQVRGEALTKRTDIFSLGIVFWELLAQRKLFSGNSVKELTDKVKICHIPRLEEFATKGSPPLFKICERALSANPQARYHTAGEMAADLQEYLRYSGIENHQSHMGKFLRDLFPDDVTHLKSLLRKYEGAPDPSSPFDTNSMAFGTDSKGFGAFELSRVARSRHVQVNRWKRTAAILGIFASVVFGYAVTSKIMTPSVYPKRVAAPVAVATPPIANAPMLATTPAPVSVPVPPVPATAPVRVSPVRGTVPTPRSTVPTVTVQQPVVAKPRMEIKRSLATQTPPPKKKPKRKPANKIPAPVISSPSAGAAYVTVLSGPNTKILINGKYVGHELTNEIKVPAGKSVVIKTVNPAGAGRSKAFTFKPASHHVIEMFD